MFFNKRTGQELFRKKLIERYKVCIITGSNAIVCQACHIIPYSESNKEDIYNIDNGLLMTYNLHVLFDNKDVIIDPITLKLHFTSNILLDKTMNEFTKYEGMKLNIHPNSVYYLKKYYE